MMDRFQQIGAFDIVPKEDLLKRIDSLRELMAQAAINYAILYQNVDRFYFAGTMQKGVVVIPAEGEALIFIEKGYERAMVETPLPITPVRNDKEVAQILDGKGILRGTAGLELDILTVSLFERLKTYMGFERYADVSPLVKELRAVKSPFEIKQTLKSGTVVSRVFAKAREVVREGTTEVDIEAALVAEGRRIGHPAYLRMRGVNQEIMIMVVQSGYTGTIPTIVDGPIAGTGITPAIPQGSSFKKVEKGVPLTIDYCGNYNGYNTDETRTFVVGNLNEVFRKPYETARAIIEDAMAFGKEGIDCTELFSRAWGMAKKAGLQNNFMGYGAGQVAFVGHGIGLEINELPVIAPRHRRILKEGMIFAFEPKFVLPPHGAIGMEVDFIVRRECFQRVTGDSFDLVQLPVK